MALLAPQQVKLPAAAHTYAAASAGGDTVAGGDDRLALHVKNGSGASITVTIVTPGTSYGSAIPDVANPVPAAGDRLISLAGRDLIDPATGLISITYSATATVTVAAVRI